MCYAGVRDQAKAASWEAQGVELVSAPWDDAAALAAAFRGAEGVFAMVPPYFAPAAGYPEVRVVAAALRQVLDATRPAKVVALSSVGAHRPRGLGLITQCYILEQEIKTVPLPKAFIRAAWFMENAQWDVASARNISAAAVPWKKSSRTCSDKKADR